MQLLLLFAAAVAAADSPQRPADLAARHGRGGRGALETLAALSEKDLRAELSSVRKLAISRRRTAADDAHLRGYPFVPSVLAYTELALRAQDASEPGPLALYCELARGYLDAAGARTAELAPRWYLLFALRHLERLELPEALHFTEEGTHAVPTDARLWLATGAVWQAVARFAPDDPDRTSTRAAYVKDRLRAVADRRARLQASERSFQRALDRDAGLHEAAARLAQVRLDLGRADDAASVLASLPASVPPEWAYLADLFRGRIAETRQRWPEAAEAYQRAADTLPRAETAWVALAHALDRRGDRGGAQVALGRVLLADRGPEGHDPFRLLPILCAGGAETVWAEMREAAR